jgi:hypothetical protein
MQCIHFSRSPDKVRACGGAMESLRDLVEKGAARHRLTTRTVWQWAFDAILRDELDATIQRNPRYNSPAIEDAHWRKLFADTRDGTYRNGDPSVNSWTRDVMLDPDRFEKGLRRAKRALNGNKQRKPGPNSRQAQMRETFLKLSSEDTPFRTKMAAYHAVCRYCGITDTQRGWSYDTFRKACALEFKTK